MPFKCFSKKSTAAKDGSGVDAKPAAMDAAKPVLEIRDSAQFIQALSTRRSIYNLGDKLPHSKNAVTKLIEAIVRQCPSSFNVQSSRLVILYGDDHKKVWEIVKDALKKATTEEKYKAAEVKVNKCFLPAAGTILFYEDQLAIKGQQEAFPSYADNFPVWSQHSSAIAQFAVWSALAQDGIGASLQHYNQLIEEQLRDAFKVPEQWQLVAQMPFGSIKKAADTKTYIADEGRFIVLDD